VAPGCAGVVLDRHPGAEEHAAAVRGRLGDDVETVEPAPQEAHAPVDLAQAPLSIDVFGVLRAVAHRGGFGHRARHGRPFHAPQFVQFGTQAPRTFGGRVLRTGLGPVSKHLNQKSFLQSPGPGLQTVARITHGRQGRV
jgi:hypothetical protein